MVFVERAQLKVFSHENAPSMLWEILFNPGPIVRSCWCSQIHSKLCCFDFRPARIASASGLMAVPALCALTCSVLRVSYRHNYFHVKEFTTCEINITRGIGFNHVVQRRLQDSEASGCHVVVVLLSLSKEKSKDAGMAAEFLNGRKMCLDSFHFIVHS